MESQQENKREKISYFEKKHTKELMHQQRLDRADNML